MKIAVCLKYGLDVNEIKVDAETLTLRMGNVPRKFGDYDYNALVEAARLGEAQGNEVDILVFGPESAKDGLKEAMAMGADKAIVIVDPLDGEADTMMSVEAIARVVEKLGGFDLIICGEASIDGASYQFVPRLAERLKMPHMAFVNRLEVDDEFVLVDRNVANRSESLKAVLPAVISVTEEINNPAKPTLIQVLKAKDKPVEVWSVEADLGVSLEELQASSGAQRIGMQGIKVERKQIVLKGMSPQEAAEQLIALLEEEEVLNHG